MTKREKIYGWIVVTALSGASIIWGGVEHTSNAFRPKVYAGFWFFSIAIPIVLVVAWLWVQSRLDKRK